MLARLPSTRLELVKQPPFPPLDQLLLHLLHRRQLPRPAVAHVAGQRPPAGRRFPAGGARAEVVRRLLLLGELVGQQRVVLLVGAVAVVGGVDLLAQVVARLERLLFRPRLCRRLEELLDAW